MIRPLVAPALVACLFVAPAERTRSTVLDRYGIEGYVQAIGIHHGFHIEKVVPDSFAADDRLKPHDVIMKVDGESIRSLEHLRAVMAEAYIDEGEVRITYSHGISLEFQTAMLHLRPDVAKAASAHRRANGDGTVR